MHILYIVQHSIYNNDGKWITADSNINMMTGIFRELTEKTNWKISVLISKLDNIANISSYDEIFKHPNVTFIPYNFPVDAFLNRQHFNVEEFSSVFSQLASIDIVWNNIIELSRNIKTYLEYKSKQTKLISCCYWMDTPEIGEAKVDSSISYQYRQFDGYECSDLCVFTCESTKEAFFSNAEKVFAKDKVDSILKKSTIWDFGFSTKEANSYFTIDSFPKKTILFLNRLSMINYTHHKEFIDAVNKLYEKRQDFQVIFTNPSGKYSFEELQKLVKPMVIYKDSALTRKEYFELLWKANISFHGYTLERYGGVAHRESLYCNNIVITPKVFEYKLIQGEDYLFYVKNDLSDLETTINTALDCTSYNMDDIKLKNVNSTFEFISNNVIKDIMRISK